MVPRSKPSAMLLEAERTARSSWSRKEPRTRRSVGEEVIAETEQLGGGLPDGEVFEAVLLPCFVNQLHPSSGMLAHPERLHRALQHWEVRRRFQPKSVAGRAIDYALDQ